MKLNAKRALLALALTLATAGPARADDARDLIAQGRCHCGCGRQLPGSPHGDACFGCSVGKAEITYILESLAAGRDPKLVLLALGESVLVEVFADYGDAGLAQTWKRARRAADALHQHRVVLRTPGRTEGALRAAAVAECAREMGRFGRMQSVLIDHPGRWDEANLLALAARADLDVDAMRTCLGEIDLGAQIGKDREHATDRKIESFPAVFVNRKAVAAEEDALRSAIRRAMLEGSI